jgi:glycerol kinase
MMRIQADTLDIALKRPKMTEITALGAAIAAGIATKVWPSVAAMQQTFGEVHVDDVFRSNMGEKEKQEKWALWEWGVERSVGWLKQNLEEVQNTENTSRKPN